MALVDRLPPHFPGRRRLGSCEASYATTPTGRRVCDNFEQSLQHGWIEDPLFQQFCRRLGQLLPRTGTQVEVDALLAQIDDPEPFFCRGPLVTDQADRLATVVDLPSYLWAHLGHAPSDIEYDEALQDWTEKLARGERSREWVRLRTRVRPFFWVARSDDIRAANPDSPDRLRDLLGLSRIRGGFLMELAYPAELVGTLHGPTILDALDAPTFRPHIGIDGWGITDDLAGPRPTDGVAEAVTREAELQADAIPWGPLAADRPRF